MLVGLRRHHQCEDGDFDHNNGNTSTPDASTPPSIATPPASQSIASGQTASFSVAASGTGPLSYQWAANGSAIAGATGSSYTTPTETTSASGTQFTVTVSNSAGTATSTAAVLTVNAGPTLSANTSSLNFNSVAMGGSSTLSVTLTNSGSTSINVTGVGLSGAGFSSSGVSSGLILQGGQSASLNVTYTPAATGGVNGSVTITSTASDPSVAIALAGTGISGPSVTLNWNPDSSTVNGYDVYRSAVSGNSYVQVNSSTVTGTSYTDTTVQSGQTYYYVVTAVGSSGVQSGYSNQAATAVP